MKENCHSLHPYLIEQLLYFVYIILGKGSRYDFMKMQLSMKLKDSSTIIDATSNQEP